MAARGLRIFLSLFLLLFIASSAKSIAARDQAQEQPPHLWQSGSNSAVCGPKPDLPYHYYLPAAFGSGVEAPPASTCEVVYQSPDDNNSLPAGTFFDARWRIKNTGSTTWLAESTDFCFVSGDRLHAGSDVMDLPHDVAENTQVDLVVTMHAPEESGTYTSNWAIAQNGSAVCRFYLIIHVQ